jgi:chromosome partitioning protein
MGKIIAFANQKGGVGKTTSCVNLSASMVNKNRSVLLIDLDPQGNATMGSGVNKQELELSSYEILMAECEPTAAIHSTQAGYDLIPANRDLTAAEVNLLGAQRKEFRLSQALAKIRGSYDYLFIDCPPSLNMLTVNALTAADTVLVPMQCEYYALEGLTGLLETIESVTKTVNSKLKLEGLLRTMYDSRNRLTGEVSDQLNKHFADKVFKTVIPRNVRLAEAPSFGLPALIYDKTSQGAQAYLELAQEVLELREREFAI